MKLLYLMQWYYAVGDERKGPVFEAQFEELVKAGVIRGDTLVWKNGMANWQPYSTLFSGISAGTPESASAVDDGRETCAVSGKRYLRREMIQYEGKWVAAEHRDEFFQRLREGVTQPGTFRYAGFWVRFVAKFIDGITLYIVAVPFNMLVGFFLLGSVNVWGRGIQVMGPQRALMYTGISLVIGIVIALVYGTFFITRFDATPGKMALGLKLVRADGSRLTVGRVIGRYFSEYISSIILAIGYIMVAFDEEKRALHDRICDTRVIKSK